MAFDLWLAFVAASAVLLVIPGPTLLLVVSYALTQGRRVAVAMAVGVALGDLIAISASLAGLGVLVMTSATLFVALKWLGAAYLVWLGLRLLRSTSAGAAAADGQDRALPAPVPARDARSVMMHATTVTALNPKSIAFFVAFVPQFLRPAEPLGPQFAILIATFVTLAALNALAFALLADRLRRRIQRPAVITWMTRAGGGALIAMGAATALLRRAS